MSQALTLVWFERDLRLCDNPALIAAIQQGVILPVYILDQCTAGESQMGAASRWWLHHSLQALDASLQGQLNYYRGDAADIIAALCDRFSITGVYWNRRYEPWQIARDTKIKKSLLAQGIEAKSFSGSLLHEPWVILKSDNSPYQVFTPYYHRASKLNHGPRPVPQPALPIAAQTDGQSLQIKELSLLPPIPWDAGFYQHWQPGETGAQQRLKYFLAAGINRYQPGRDFPAQGATSTLSPHIHFGEISPRTIIDSLGSVPDSDSNAHFKKEIGWREFSHYLLFYWPELPHKNLRPNLDNFPWQNDPGQLRRWQQGKTGYPLVDAGMRQLWTTGYMHNRVRMVTASFLIKNLLIDWRFGARWFWDCLVDADLASNSASWQWVAGCGTDASPYFRIFNPTTQGEKFDRNGEYTRHYLPELKDLPNKYLFRPWQAPAEVLAEAGLVLGDHYPLPMVDIAQSRQTALESYAACRASNGG